MQRRLIVMRHAKSSWEAGIASDRERTLNERGRRDAPRIARRLIELGWAPDAVHSSDAERTRETWRRMAPEFKSEPPVEYHPEYYLRGLDAIRMSAYAWGSELATVLVIGHNPGWALAATELTGEPIEFSTGNAALLEGAGDDWSSALIGPWRLEALLRPKEL